MAWLMSTSQNTGEEIKGIARKLGVTSASVEAVHEAMPILLQQATHQQVVLQKLYQMVQRMQYLQVGLSRPDAEMQKQVSISFLSIPRLTFMKNQAINTLQSTLIRKPSLCRSVCDELGSSRIEPIKMSSILEQNASARNHSAPSLLRHRGFSINRSTRCSCRPSTYSFKLNGAPGFQKCRQDWGAMLNTSSVNHRKECPLSGYSKSENLLKIRLWYCGRILAQVVEASIHLTRGAGGFSISPNLSFRCVVPSDSVAFKLVKEMMGQFHCHGEQQQILDDGIEALTRLFQGGKASPRDVDVNGNSLLHVNCPINCISQSFD